MIKKVSYKDQVYEYLRHAIVDGSLHEGEIYSEQMIADKLNISRTPVREAVLQLRNEDLIEVYLNRGFGVKPVSVEHINEIIQAREAIEECTLRCLAEGAGTQKGQEALAIMEDCLENTMKKLRDQDNHYEFMQADMEFHEVSINYTGNMYFARIFQMMRAQVERVTISSLVYKNRHEMAFQEHERILKALKAGDGDEAVRALQDHMDKTRELMSRHM
ncbi:Transcriptional regulator, GntR family [Anaerovibrio sp. JC8]|uniref:GntR family transcriptional regulator n=1 Tax=Anaerovibrio sp. JC8 TaxID=1240085 RepID=UPI000A0ACBDD|nr:GntR family transcriptional regulator [Anaerovibrio sp. JC8]ORU00762.1 Transcriptional regulator, GntR family [Anaerovibrio sp. JC8]